MTSKKSLVLIGIGVVSIVAITAISAKSIYKQVMDALDFLDEDWFDDDEQTELKPVVELKKSTGTQTP